MNKLKVVHDSYPQSPREDDNLGTIAYKHQNYNLGDEKISDPIEWLEDILNLNRKYQYSNERLKELEYKFFTKFVALPLYLYDHSGITIKTTPFGCKWDSGKVGYVYVSKEKIKEEYSVKTISKKIREKVLNVLVAEVGSFDTYIRNDIYGFQIVDENEDVIDSCYGFYGTDFTKNGMLDYIDGSLLGINEEELVKQLEEIEVEY